MAYTVESFEELKQSATSEAEALEKLKSLDTADIKDANYHAAVARWAQQLDELEISLREWNLAHRDNPNDISVMQELIEAYLDAGRLEKAVRILRQQVKLDSKSVKSWESLMQTLHQLGEIDQAEDVRRRASLLTGDPRFKIKLKSEDKLFGDESSSYEPDDAFLALFQERFQGREGVYARQWVDPKGATGYSPVREPLNFRAIKMHLQGSHTLGIYPLRMDNTVFFAAFDLDLSQPVIKSSAPGSTGWNEAISEMEKYADLLEGRARHMGITLHRADSGYKGLHLWALFGEAIPARQARQMCKVIAHGNAVPLSIRYEIFPKQNALPPDGLGNLIKVPLGIHRKTGRRVWFRNAKPSWEEQHLYLQRATLISRDQLNQCQDVYAEGELAKLTRVDFELEPYEKKCLPASGAIVRHTSKDLNPYQETPLPATSHTRLEAVPLEPPLYDPANDEKLQLLLSRCATLRAVWNKVDQTGQLDHDEIRVLTYTIGHLATGPMAVNWVLARCLQTDPSLFLKRPLRGNPMSCAKIRATIPEITSNVSCNCQFPRSSGLYPNPLLHLSQPTEGMPLEQLQFQAILSDFLRAKKEAFRWNQLLEEYSAKVDLWFDQSGLEQLQTSFGLLRRNKDPETGKITFELIV